MPEIPEPGNRAIVAWINDAGVPGAAYVRIDEYAEDQTPRDRWFDADEERGGYEGGVEWNALCARYRTYAWHGPYLLNVGELLGGTDVQ